MDRIAVVFIGDAQWPEFHDVHRWLSAHSSLAVALDLPAALTLVEQGDCEPALIVLAQRWPGEFPDRRLARLRKAAPLARFSELLGSWCEQPAGEGEPVAGALSHYWHRWIPRMGPEFALEPSESSVWSLPPTATDEERLLEISKRPQRGNRGLLAIHSRDAEMAAVLCDAAGSRGFAAVWVREPSMSHIAGIRAGVWNATTSSAGEAQEMNRWRAALGGVPTAALIDFPRIEDRQRFLEAGAAAIVSKPFWLDDVFWQIEQL